MSYYEAPVEVLEDARQLTEWARRSVAVAQRAPPPKGRKAVRRKARGARGGGSRRAGRARG
jgi:TfoX/Sxy family transcriptional regulator of competence genes